MSEIEGSSGPLSVAQFRSELNELASVIGGAGWGEGTVDGVSLSRSVLARGGRQSTELRLNIERERLDADTETVIFYVIHAALSSVNDFPPQIVDLMDYQDEPLEVDDDNNKPNLQIRDEVEYWICLDEESTDVQVTHERTFEVDGNSVHSVKIVDGEPQWIERDDYEFVVCDEPDGLSVTDFSITRANGSDDPLEALFRGRQVDASYYIQTIQRYLGLMGPMMVS